MTDNQIIAKRPFFWNKPEVHEANDIKEIRIETTQGYASGAVIDKKDGNQIFLTIRWRNQIKDLSEFAIKNKIDCSIEETYHGGQVETIYSNNADF